VRQSAAVLAGLTLAIGFALAQVSGNRPLGGAVLLIGAVICGFLWWRSAGALPAIASGVVFSAGFVASHPLAKVIGSWPSVAIVAIATALITYTLTATQRVAVHLP